MGILDSALDTVGNAVGKVTGIFTGGNSGLSMPASASDKDTTLSQAMKEAAMQGDAPGNAINKRKGGAIHSASKRADGIAQRGKTKGTLVMCGGGYMKGKK